MKVLVFGAGNLLLSDEGFGVHFIQHLEAHYTFPEGVELFDAGTLGIMATHKIEEAERVYIIDTVIGQSQEVPGQCFRYEKDDFMQHRLPVKLSPHQIGVQEMLMISELRGCCPREITLFGVIPASIELGYELTPILRACIEDLAIKLVRELTDLGLAPVPKPGVVQQNPLAHGDLLSRLEKKTTAVIGPIWHLGCALSQTGNRLRLNGPPGEPEPGHFQAITRHLLMLRYPLHS